MIYEFLDGRIVQSLTNKEEIELGEHSTSFIKRIGFRKLPSVVLEWNEVYGIWVYEMNNSNTKMIDMVIHRQSKFIIIKSTEDYLSFLAKFTPMIESMINITQPAKQRED